MSANYAGTNSRFVTLLSSPSNSSQNEDSVPASEVDEISTKPAAAKNQRKPRTKKGAKNTKVVPAKDKPTKNAQREPVLTPE